MVNLAFEDDASNVVLMANALHIMPSPSDAIREIHRVLKDDGVVILPTFIYEGKVNKFRLWMMSIAGFKVYHKWNAEQYQEVIRGAGFDIIDTRLYPSKIGPECVVVARKIAGNNM